MSFDTPLALSGPLRQPRQMLADQEYGGHASIHDDAMAEKLGFRAGPIEGPTHFSLFPPLLEKLWGKAWYERGCLSAHYMNMVVEGESVRAFVEIPAEGATRTRAWAEKADGTPVLEASASLGPDHGQTLLEGRLAALRPHGPLLILADLKVGMPGKVEERVRTSVMASTLWKPPPAVPLVPPPAAATAAPTAAMTDPPPPPPPPPGGGNTSFSLLKVTRRWRPPPAASPLSQLPQLPPQVALQLLRLRLLSPQPLKLCLLPLQLQLQQPPVLLQLLLLLKQFRYSLGLEGRRLLGHLKKEGEGQQLSSTTAAANRKNSTRKGL